MLLLSPSNTLSRPSPQFHWDYIPRQLRPLVLSEYRFLLKGTLSSLGHQMSRKKEGRTIVYFSEAIKRNLHHLWEKTLQSPTIDSRWRHYPNTREFLSIWITNAFEDRFVFVCLLACYSDNADLKLLGSGNPPTSTFQVTWLPWKPPGLLRTKIL